jgi:hypothetical protein
VDGGGGTEYARSLAVGSHSRASAGFPALLRSLGAKWFSLQEKRHIADDYIRISLDVVVVRKMVVPGGRKSDCGRPHSPDT